MDKLLEYLALGAAGIAIWSVVDNNIRLYRHGFASPPLIPPSSNTLPPPAPVPQILPGPLVIERHPSHIKESVNPDIHKEQKHKKKEKKMAQIPDDHQVHAQIECHDGLECGSNCYHDGKLWKIVCSERERDELYPAVVPEEHGEPPGPQPSTPGNAVGISHFTQNTGFTNGCGRSQNKDPYISCRAGIGTGKDGTPTKEAGNQTRSVESLLTDKNHFYAIYDFNINPSAHVVSGHPQDVEITGGYHGSSHSDPAVGVTIGIKPNGTPFCKKEDESRQSWPTICEGNCGGVSKVPNLGTNFSLVWAADKFGSTVTYRGYVRTNGQEYLIAKINPGIDFTVQNTYIRGRTNQLGNICPTGLLYDGRYQSPTEVKGFTYIGPEGYIKEGEGYF